MVVFTGSTVEEAIQKGLKELDIPRRLISKSFLVKKMAFLVYLVKDQLKLILKLLVKQRSLKLISRL